MMRLFGLIAVILLCIVCIAALAYCCCRYSKHRKQAEQCAARS